MREEFDLNDGSVSDLRAKLHSVAELAEALTQQTVAGKLRELEEMLRVPMPETVGDLKEEITAGAQPSILLVDDDRHLNRIICQFLMEEGYRVEAAFDGLEGLRMFSPSEQTVVLTDVAMPRMNGWELAAALHQRAPKLPIVLITGFGGGNWSESDLRSQGVSAVLHKPLDLDQLVAVLRTAVENSQAVTR